MLSHHSGSDQSDHSGSVESVGASVHSEASRHSSNHSGSYHSGSHHSDSHQSGSHHSGSHAGSVNGSQNVGKSSTTLK